MGGVLILDPAVCVRPFTLDHRTAHQVISRIDTTRLDFFKYVQHYVGNRSAEGNLGIRSWLSYVYVSHDLRAKWPHLVRAETGVPRLPDRVWHRRAHFEQPPAQVINLFRLQSETL